MTDRVLRNCVIWHKCERIANRFRPVGDCRDRLRCSVCPALRFIYRQNFQIWRARSVHGKNTSKSWRLRIVTVVGTVVIATVCDMMVVSKEKHQFRESVIEWVCVSEYSSQSGSDRCEQGVREGGYSINSKSASHSDRQTDGQTSISDTPGECSMPDACIYQTDWWTVWFAFIRKCDRCDKMR